MKAKELRKKSRKELQALLNNLRKELAELRFKIAAKQLKNVRKFREVRKDIARILKIIRKKKEDNKK